LTPTDSNRITIGWRQFNSVTPTSGKAALVTQRTAGFTGRSLVFWKTTSFAAIPFWIQTNWERFSISAFATHFCDNIWQSTDGGQSWSNFLGTSGGDKEWFTVDKTGGPGHGFHYQFWTDSFPAHPANLAVPQMAG
jgi:hypothetical protein